MSQRLEHPLEVPLTHASAGRNVAQPNLLVQMLLDEIDAALDLLECRHASGWRVEETSHRSQLARGVVFTVAHSVTDHLTALIAHVPESNTPIVMHDEPFGDEMTAWDLAMKLAHVVQERIPAL